MLTGDVAWPQVLAEMESVLSQFEADGSGGGRVGVLTSVVAYEAEREAEAELDRLLAGAEEEGRGEEEEAHELAALPLIGDEEEDAEAALMAELAAVGVDDVDDAAAIAAETEELEALLALEEAALLELEEAALLDSLPEVGGDAEGSSAAASGDPSRSEDEEEAAADAALSAPSPTSQAHIAQALYGTAASLAAPVRQSPRGRIVTTPVASHMHASR